MTCGRSEKAIKLSVFWFSPNILGISLGNCGVGRKSLLDSGPTGYLLQATPTTIRLLLESSCLWITSGVKRETAQTAAKGP